MNDPEDVDISYLLGLDLGQSSDPSALTVTEKQVPWRVATDKDQAERGSRIDGKPRYAVRHIQRFELGTSYPDIVREVASIYGAAATGRDPTLVMDATGVGAPVVDQFHEHGLRPVQVVFTGGDEVKQEGQKCKVPKADLATTVQTLLQGRRLEIARELPHASQLTQEMKRFRVKISDSGHARFEHATESDTDDVLLSLACALWYGERGNQARLTLTTFDEIFG